VGWQDNPWFPEVLLIWVGKQYCGQRDRVDVEGTVDTPLSLIEQAPKIVIQYVDVKVDANSNQGTSDGGSGGGGTVFRLAPAGNGDWTFSLVFSFTGHVGSQCGPVGTLIIDGTDNVDGATRCDGANEAGNVFKLERGSRMYTDLTGGNDGGFPYGVLSIDANGILYGTAKVGGAYNWGLVWEITP
jgi:hypothetical protein